MAALRQFKLPSQLPDQAYQGIMTFFETADHVIMVGTSEKNNQTFNHYEILFDNIDDFPVNENANNYKTDVIIPHEFIGYETLTEYENRKNNET